MGPNSLAGAGQIEAMISSMAKRTNSAHRSWLPSANDPGTDFPLTHLPYGLFQSAEGPHLCVAIGMHLLDLHQCAAEGLLPAVVGTACQSGTLNELMALGAEAWDTLRQHLIGLLHESADPARRRQAEAALHSISSAKLLKPVDVRNYTDFYASIHHATRVGKLFRPDQPLLPNYKYVPIGYHGRASSLIVSGTDVMRPSGQVLSAQSGPHPQFQKSSRLDYELELAFYIGQGNAQGQPIPISEAGTHLFGVSLLNDWSARDIQSWEYQPLGPFLGKSFATSISPWITPMAALEPFRTSATPRPASDPEPLPYLYLERDQEVGTFDIKVEVLLLTRFMKINKLSSVPLSVASSRDLYWTAAQLVTHHTSNGCNLQPGDILATGTISGAEETSAGCLLELTRNGAMPLSLPTGETRRFLEDGDEVIFRASCESPGHPRIGLGECRGRLIG